MLTGLPPFYSSNRENLFKDILCSELTEEKMYFDCEGENDGDDDDDDTTMDV